MNVTQFRLLGPLEVSDDGTPLPLGGTGQRALLALLLLHANEVVSSDRLLDELWDGAPPASGATALQVRVSQLRKGLGRVGERVETRPPGYVVRVEPGELDLDRFSRLVDEAGSSEPEAAVDKLRDALMLWRGPALADVAYESFAQPAISRLEELRLMALEKRIEAELALGRHVELVAEVEALVREHPLRERPHGQLMLALYRSGRQAEALGAYRRLRSSLVEELGVEPGPALQELERAILRQEPGLELEAMATVDRSILVAPLASDRLESLLALAAPLARRPPKELILTAIVPHPDDLGPTAAALDERRSALLADGLAARAATFVSSSPGADIVRFATEQAVDLVVVDATPQLLADQELQEILASAPCDVAIMLGESVRPGPVLVPFVGAEHDWAAIELGAWAAGAFDSLLLIAGPRQGTKGTDSSRLLANASLAIQRTLGVSAQPLLLEPGQEELVAAAADAALVVIGLSARWQRHGLGEARGALVTAGRTPVVLVKRGLRPGGLAPPETLTRFTWTLRS
jgi:DNA-binding SARP family transcriptional activator